MGQGGGWTYRDPGTLGAWARRLLWAKAALSAAAIILVWARGFEPANSGAPEAALLLVDVLLFVAAAILTLRWIYVANANAHALGASDMMVSPGWAVGWFFVPLMNLAMPFIAVREMWKASANPRDWQMQPTPAAIPAWWALWLVSGVTGMIGFRLSLELEKGEGAAAEMFFVASDLAFIPALLLLAWIIGRIDSMQSRGVPAEVFV
ncbi:MAG TPA: DUF4328 domain-containing protein [Allosphingosinicella sp.]|nr:DUF4328 domain-containing protein [Allosphingosinicella sp.]